MNLAPVVERFSSTFSVARPSASAYGSDGRLDAPTITTISIRALAYPASGRELQILPEGLRAKETRSLLTTTQLRAGADPDVVTIDGEAWQCQNVERWDMIANYWRALVQRAASQ